MKFAPGAAWAGGVTPICIDTGARFANFLPTLGGVPAHPPEIFHESHPFIIANR
jgi:hypothetical protein